MLNLTDFLDYLHNASPAKRLIMLHNQVDWEKLRSWAIDKNFQELNFASLFPGNSFLHDIGDLLERIVNEADNNQVKLLVTGLNPYLYLLDSTLLKQASYQLARWLEEQSGHNIFILAWSTPSLYEALQNYSALHRLKESRWLVELAGVSNYPKLNAELVSANLGQIYDGRSDNIHTLSEFLALHDGVQASDELAIIMLDSSSWPISGINQDIIQRYEIDQSLNDIYEEQVTDLSVRAKEWLLNFAARNKVTEGRLPKISSHAILMNFFGEGGLESGILRLWRGCDPTEREVLFWLLPAICAKDTYLSESYLKAVCTWPGVDMGNFERVYVEGWTIGQKAWAEERRRAILNAGLDEYKAYLEMFIIRHKNEESERIAPWLNCGTLAERAELLRRWQVSGPSDAILKVYPNLAAYLGDEAGILDGYFLDYRHLVVRNEINEQFMQKQAEANDRLREFPTRDSLLQRYVHDSALLVVDALGAEWLPMLLKLAKAHGLKTVGNFAARAALPTITAKNIIYWPMEHRLPDIKSLDNVAHNGVEAHERQFVHENLAKMLEVPERICDAVKKALFDYSRVIVTGDHGISRLAALAVEKKEFSKKLENCSSQGRLRYCPADDIRGRANNLTSSLDGAFLCINNYDRFSKGGYKGFAMHGGATPEEWLVPVLVFELPVIDPLEAQRTVQIIEDSDFDI